MKKLEKPIEPKTDLGKNLEYEKFLRAILQETLGDQWGTEKSDAVTMVSIRVPKKFNEIIDRFKPELVQEFMEHFFTLGLACEVTKSTLSEIMSSLNSTPPTTH